MLAHSGGLVLRQMTSRSNNQLYFQLACKPGPDRRYNRGYPHIPKEARAATDENHSMSTTIHGTFHSANLHLYQLVRRGSFQVPCKPVFVLLPSSRIQGELDAYTRSGAKVPKQSFDTCASMNRSTTEPDQLDQLQKWSEGRSRLEYLFFSPRVHHPKEDARYPAQTRISSAKWRDHVNDKKASVIWNIPWNPISSFLRVNETPNIVLEVREREVFGDLENALAYKELKPLITVPNCRHPFRKASTQSVIDPKGFPFFRPALSPQG